MVKALNRTLILALSGLGLMGVCIYELGLFGVHAYRVPALSIACCVIALLFNPLLAWVPDEQVPQLLRLAGVLMVGFAVLHWKDPVFARVSIPLAIGASTFGLAQIERRLPRLRWLALSWLPLGFAFLSVLANSNSHPLLVVPSSLALDVYIAAYLIQSMHGRALVLTSSVLKTCGLALVALPF